jgi:uncharacterized membrane protein YhaH (DUF805 family)
MLRNILLVGAAVGLLAIALIACYAVSNRSGHTAWEPFTALALFVPLMILGACGMTRRRVRSLVRAGTWAFLVGLAGTVLIVALDQSNSLVQYERWLRRGLS